MLVGIDAFGCDHGRSGLGLYLLSLISSLPKSDSVTYELFGSEIDRYTYTSSLEKISFTGVSVPDSVVFESLWHTFKASSFLTRRNYDVAFFAAGGRFLPASFPVPGVAAVNDVISEMPDYKSSFFYRHKIKSRLSRCKKIITASQFIKKDLVSMSIESSNIEVIHNGINHSLFYPRTVLNNDVVNISPFAIKRPYIIYASKLQGSSKKHLELIKAFSLFKKNTGLPHRLVLAGGSGGYSEAVHKETASSEYSSDIFLTGFFPHESLPELYSCADACIIPSVSEGAGLPVLEAMACGIPVACAKAGALPEIAGSNALFFNPNDINETAKTIEAIVSDTNLRSNLISGGITWAKRFSWEKTAQRTLEVLQETVQGRK